MAQTSKEGA